MTIHIVQGITAIPLMLKKYNLLNHTLINNDDDLSIGPLFDIDSISPSSRKIFLKEILSEIIFIENKTENQLIEIHSKLSTLRITLKNIIFWYGNNAKEILFLHRAAWYLRNNTKINISEIVLPSDYFSDRQGLIAMLPHDKLWEFYQNRQLVNMEKLESWASEWEIIRNKHEGIYIWRNNRLEIVPDTFFDTILLELVTDNWVLSSRIVSEILITSYLTIEDSWLFWRLNKLIDAGKLEKKTSINHSSPTTFYVRKIPTSK